MWEVICLERTGMIVESEVNVVYIRHLRGQDAAFHNGEDDCEDEGSGRERE